MIANLIIFYQEDLASESQENPTPLAGDWLAKVGFADLQLEGAARTG
jgi:hypothetical protein